MMRNDDRHLYDALATRLHDAGLARVVDKVLRLARPAIRLALTRTPELAIPVGASKVGGTADLPPGVEWPGWRGDPLPFIAQVRLEDVAVLDAEGDLPHQGLLSFFYTPNEPDGELRVDEDPTAWRVLYTADATRVERRRLPDAMAKGFETAFPACAVAVSRRLTLPDDPESAAVRALGFTNDERLGYINVVGGSDVGFDEEMDHRLLGYPYTLGGYPFLQGYLARNGLERPTMPVDLEAQERQHRAMATLQEAAKEWRPPAEGYQTPDDVWHAIAEFAARVDMGPLTRAVEDLHPAPAPPDLLARMEEQRRAAETEWRLLLQVYSNGEAEMDWAGGGVIHFSIARDDLKARDFSRVWVDLDFV